MALFSWQKKPKEDGTEEFTLPDELQNQIKAGADAAAQMPKLMETLNGLKSIMETQSKAQKDKEDAEAAAALRLKNSKNQEETDAEIEELFLTDPKAAIAKATQGHTSAILTLNASNIRREVFEDEKEFKYYHGDIKKEVDTLIAGQTLQARNDPSVIKNCYLTVLGRHNDEIVEGKIKSRFAGSTGTGGTSNGSAGSSGAADDKASILRGLENDPMVLKAARTLGMKPADYAKMLDEEGIGYA
jgi:hypothetical protein